MKREESEVREVKGGGELRERTQKERRVVRGVIRKCER